MLSDNVCDALDAAAAVLGEAIRNLPKDARGALCLGQRLAAWDDTYSTRLCQLLQSAYLAGCDIDVDYRRPHCLAPHPRTVKVPFTEAAMDAIREQLRIVCDSPDCQLIWTRPAEELPSGWEQRAFSHDVGKWAIVEWYEVHDTADLIWDRLEEVQHLIARLAYARLAQFGAWPACKDQLAPLDKLRAFLLQAKQAASRAQLAGAGGVGTDTDGEEEGAPELPAEYDVHKGKRILYGLAVVFWNRKRPVEKAKLEELVWEKVKGEGAYRPPDLGSTLNRFNNKCTPPWPFTLHEDGSGVTKKPRTSPHM